MFCHGTQTTDDSKICLTVCCSINIISKTSCSHFSIQGSYYGYTHAWTKLYNEVMNWISGAYESGHYARSLPEANSTTVRDLTVPPVSSQPLSLMVCSCNHQRGVDNERSIVSTFRSRWRHTLQIANIALFSGLPTVQFSIALGRHRNEANTNAVTLHLLVVFPA